MRPTLNAEEPVIKANGLIEKHNIKDLEYDTEDTLSPKTTLLPQFKLQLANGLKWRSLLVDYHNLFSDNGTLYMYPWYDSKPKKEWVFVNCWSMRSLQENSKKIKAGDIGIHLLYTILALRKTWNISLPL